MSSLPGLIGLMVFIYVRPHEFVPELENYNFLYVFLGLCLVGMIHDIAERRAMFMSTPALGWALLFCGWCIFSLLVRRPDLVTTNVTNILVCLVLYLVLAHGIQRIQTLFKVVVAIFAFGLFVACVGAEQGLTPFQCVIRNPGDMNGRGWADGRECVLVDSDGTRHDGVYDCVLTGNPGVVYTCEHPGLFGTTSVGGGRVRYLGVLQDPNELALATALAVPFAFALFELRRTLLRLGLLLFSLVVVAIEIVYTQSRGGQLTFAAVLGAYFIKKYGWKRGLVVGAAMGIPMVLLGGRSDEDADASTIERLGCAAAGIQMIVAHPISGVGYSQFTENHFLTAHNAYVLAAGELGAVGMWLFAFLIYLSTKIPVYVVRLDMPDDEESRITQAIAMALLAAFAGGIVGIFFLSWTYHYVLWIHFGLSGALYASVKRRFPSFEVPFSWKEKATIAFGYVAFLVFWTQYIKHKGAWE